MWTNGPVTDEKSLCFYIQAAGVRGSISERQGGSQQLAGAAKTGTVTNTYKQYNNDLEQYLIDVLKATGFVLSPLVVTVQSKVQYPSSGRGG